MTQEEKARAYDAAIEKVKSLYKQAKKDGCPIWSTYETIFPQLAESEDERIIHCLEEIIDWGCSKNIAVECGVDLKAVKSWLEKQKERGPLTKEEEYTLYRIIEYFEDEDEHPEWVELLRNIYNLPYVKQKEQKPAVSREEILHQLLQNGSITLSDYLYLTEKQKPAEWSEEDEEMYTILNNVIKSSLGRTSLSNYIDRENLFKLKKWLENRFKSIRPCHS